MNQDSINVEMALPLINLPSEQDYINKFCSEYHNDILTPDGFMVKCTPLVATAKHVCGGKIYKFQIRRAKRIIWPKKILLDMSVRTVLVNTTYGDNKIFFYYNHRRNAYIVICNNIKSHLELVTGYPVLGSTKVKYRNVESPFSLY